MTIKYRTVWIDGDTIKATRPIGPSLAYAVLERLLTEGRKAFVVRRRPDGTWTRQGTHTPAVTRRVTVTSADLG